MDKRTQEREEIGSSKSDKWYVDLRDKLRDVESDVDRFIRLGYEFGKRPSLSQSNDEEATVGNLNSLERSMWTNDIAVATKLKESTAGMRAVLEGLHERQVELEKLAEKLTYALAGIQKFESLFSRLEELVEKEEREKTKYR